MIYFNIEFFALFIATFVVYLFFPSKKIRFGVLLASSALFYAWAGTFDTLIFAFVILCSWLAVFLASRHPRWKTELLATGISLMALHLFFWKYAAWLTHDIQAVYPTFLGGRALVLPLPVGISFFTLQGIAYLVDYSRGEAQYMSLRKYGLFKSFFPQLVAGPIVRSKQLLPQIERLDTPTNRDICRGLALFAAGLAKKMVIADHVSVIADRVFADPGSYSRGALVWAAVLYSVQIWADFSGYTDMGRGCARMLGFSLPENFRSPYLALTPAEFWRRWHITLSLWIRDYIYIPLGGNRGSRLRVLGVVVATMAISGLWHGAAWTFMFWGLYHGALLVAERGLRLSAATQAVWATVPAKVRQALLWASMSAATVFGWILFRAENFPSFAAYIRGLASGSGVGTLPRAYVLMGYAAIGATLGYQVLFYSDTSTGEYSCTRLFGAARKRCWDVLERYSLAPGVCGAFVGAAMAAAFVVIFLTRSEHPSAFIYFQF